jgi:hypothetical protein
MYTHTVTVVRKHCGVFRRVDFEVHGRIGCNVFGSFSQFLKETVERGRNLGGNRAAERGESPEAEC